MSIPPVTENYNDKIKLLENTLKNTKDKKTIRNDIKELKKLKKIMEPTIYIEKLKLLEEELNNPVNIKTLKSDIKKIKDLSEKDHSVLNAINNCL